MSDVGRIYSAAGKHFYRTCTEYVTATVLQEVDGFTSIPAERIFYWMHGSNILTELLVLSHRRLALHRDTIRCLVCFTVCLDVYTVTAQSPAITRSTIRHLL